MEPQKCFSNTENFSPRLFPPHFCVTALFWLCRPNACCREPADCSHKETETWGGRTQFGCSLTISQVSNTRWPPLTTRQRPLTSLLLWHMTICLWATTIDDPMEMTRVRRRSDPGEIEIYNTPLLCRHLTRVLVATTSFTARMAAGCEPLGQNLWVQGARAFLGFAPRICTLGAPCS